uniref:Ig-like domain-containing protein n=1 Tax=Echeneis naucrates TaxID=173247 RepID=A0A665W594_ECHNA
MVFAWCILHFPGNKGENNKMWIMIMQSLIFKNLEIKCEHNMTNHDRIFWYKQDQNQLKMLGFLNAIGTFTVKNLEPEDTGWYFCAVSEHSDTDTCES